MRENRFEGNLVWKVILPIGATNREYEKWSPNWERSFKILYSFGGHHILQIKLGWKTTEKEYQ